MFYPMKPAPCRRHLAGFAVVICFALSHLCALAGDLDDGEIAFKAKDYERAFQLIKPLSDKGVAKAQTYAARMYAYGLGTAANVSEALKLARLAAVQGNGEGSFLLGAWYKSGTLVPQDLAEALKWYRMAANQGNTNAQVNIGVMYLRGQGVQRDYDEAMAWYRKAAALGDAGAFYNIGEMYEEGYGVVKDYKEAARWYLLAESKKPDIAKRRLNIPAIRQAADEINFSSTSTSATQQKSENTGSIQGKAVALTGADARQHSGLLAYVGDATDTCFQQLHSDVKVKVLSTKLAFDLDKPQSMELLTNLSKPNAKEKVAIDYYSMEWQRCHELGSEWRKRNLSPDVNALLSAFKVELTSSLADLYSGQISYGTAAKLRAKQWVDFKNSSEAVSRRLSAQTTENERQHQDQQKRNATLAQERAEQERARQQAEANQLRAAESQRVQEQEQAALRAQWAEQQQEQARQRVASCMAAMYARPTKTGAFGESMANAAQCNSDSNAHLIQLPPTYTCRRDFRGVVQCTPQ